MKTALKALLGLVGLLIILAIGVKSWMSGLAKDDGGAGRPTYGTFKWTKGAPAGSATTPGAVAIPGASANPGVVTETSGTSGAAQPGRDVLTLGAPPFELPRGGPTPRADGYVMGSLGNDFILPPMPPERLWDIHRADSVHVNNSLRTCFWPGPKLRPGFYTTDPDDYGIENQLPDTMNTFSTAWFKIPAGAKIVVKGEFPRMRHWSFTTYSENGVPRDVMDDDQIEPDPGSFNPFRPGVARDATPRRYTFAIANGMPPTPRPANTVYTLAEPGVAIGMHMRNYVPDRSIDWLGGVEVPQVELHMADGKVLKGEEACAGTDAPLRAKQVPLTVPKATWLALNSLPWRSADRTPAHAFEVEPMEKFYNREYLILKTFFPFLALDSFAVEKGGFWSNLATRYGYKYLSQTHGKVYAVRGKMPSVPLTWSGDTKPMDQNADMRYWSMCTVNAPATGNTVDCLFDEAVVPTVDKKGYYTVVVTRGPDRPANATEKCGVAWMEWGNGDGIPGGSPHYGAIINRHTHVNPKFSNSWFAVKKPDSEREALGEYLPHVVNFHDKERFEALGCPVDVAKMDAMIKQGEHK